MKSNSWSRRSPRQTRISPALRTLQDDLERTRDELSRVNAEVETLSRECARWFDAAILARAEQVLQPPPSSRTRSFIRRFRAGRSRIRAAALGDRARDKGEWERAARFYVDALARDSAVPELWLQLGHSLKAAGKSMEAEFAYRQAATLQSD